MLRVKSAERGGDNAATLARRKLVHCVDRLHPTRGAELFVFPRWHSDAAPGGDPRRRTADMPQAMPGSADCPRVCVSPPSSGAAYRVPI